jgi:hypothetical protein
MFNISYLAIAAFGFGLVVTLALAAWLTPALWWRQLNARALAIVGVGTWGIGTMVLALAQPPAPASQVAFRVYQDLNLRAAKGTQSARIALVPAGSVVTTTGARDGDWWQVSTQVDGKEVRGWSSSLWLRRPDE